MTTPHEVAKALAAVFQSAALVEDAAHGRSLEPTQLCPLLEAVLIVDAPNVDGIYGASLTLGLRSLETQLSPGARPTGEVLRYVFAMLRLAHQFQRASVLRQEMDKRLARLQAQRAHFPVDHETLIEAFAETYSATLATLPRRIEVRGQRGALSQPRTAALIRACLLAGVRGAILYFQLGGRRRHLFLQRRRLVGAAQALCEELP